MRARFLVRGCLWAVPTHGRRGKMALWGPFWKVADSAHDGSSE